LEKLTCSLLSFENLKNDILKFLKNLKKNVDADNVEFYQFAKFELKISHILGCAKITKYDRF
jgi:hypothetical protein